MVKKFFIIGIVLVMCVGIFSRCDLCKERTPYAYDDCHERLEMTENYSDNHRNSWPAYEEALTHFKTYDGNYTDDFGGAFIDNNGIVNICIVGYREPVKSDYLIYKRVNLHLIIYIKSCRK